MLQIETKQNENAVSGRRKGGRGNSKYVKEIPLNHQEEGRSKERDERKINVYISDPNIHTPLKSNHIFKRRKRRRKKRRRKRRTTTRE